MLFGFVVPIPTFPPKPLTAFGITIKFPAIDAWVWPVVIPVKAKGADAVATPPISTSTVLFLGYKTPLR